MMTTTPTPASEALLASDADFCTAAERAGHAMRARQHTRDGRLVAVTWNVWFSPTAFDQRLRALMREVLEAGADLVGFQEATPRFESGAARSALPPRPQLARPRPQSRQFLFRPQPWLLAHRMASRRSIAARHAPTWACDGRMPQALRKRWICTSSYSGCGVRGCCTRCWRP